MLWEKGEMFRLARQIEGGGCDPDLADCLAVTTFGSVSKLGQRPPVVDETYVQTVDHGEIPTFDSKESIRDFLRQRNQETRYNHFRVLSDGCWRSEEWEELLVMVSDAEHLRTRGPTPKRYVAKESVEAETLRPLARIFASHLLDSNSDLDAPNKSAVFLAAMACVFAALANYVQDGTMMLWWTFFSLFCWRIFIETGLSLKHEFLVPMPPAHELDADQSARLAAFAVSVVVSPVAAILLGVFVLWNEQIITPRMIRPMMDGKLFVFCLLGAVVFAARGLDWKPLVVALSWAAVLKVI